MRRKEIDTYILLTKCNYPDDSANICKTCDKSLTKSTLPKFATPENIQTNSPLEHIKVLSQLEERLVSLRIAFAQIWELGHKRSQLGLTRSIINVPVNLNIVQKDLLLSLNNTSTILVSLKQRLEYKSVFQKGMVRPNIIIQALFEFAQTTLY